MHKTKVNDIKVHRLKNVKDDPRPVKGAQLCPEVYSNVFLLGRKKKGKTTVIGNILQHCIDKDTKVYIFSSTVQKDSGWRAITEALAEKGNEVHTFLGLKEEGQNMLKQVIDELKTEPVPEIISDEDSSDKEVIDEELEIWLKQYGMGSQRKPKPKKKKKPKKKEKKHQVPEIVFIFDDLSTELRDRSIATLLKKNRHFKARVLISSHVVTDLQPGSRTQIDLWILMGNTPEDKLAIVHKDSNTALSLDDFMTRYKEATKKPHGFLWLETNRDEYRDQFNERID